MAWHDDISLKLYVSKTGDFVSLGERTQIPFNTGGGGIPAGSTFYTVSGSASDVNLTTANGRFSISNATNDPLTNREYGAKFSFPVVANKRYIVNVQAQTMEGKSTAQRLIKQASNSVEWGIDNNAVSPWENIALYGTFETVAGTMTVTLAVRNIDPTIIPWGVQFQNLSVIALDQTYPAPTWQEVTCDIRSLIMRMGRERMTNRYEVGQATIGVLNDSGDFTYQPNHPWGLRPGRFLKVEAYNGALGPYSLYYGIIDGMQDSYTVDGHALTTINCVDISSLLSNQDVPSMSNPSTMQLSGTRWIQILNGVGWHPSQTSRTNGVFYQQGIVGSGRTVRDELGLIADSEGSYFFADRAGYLIYRGRDWNDSRITTVQAELLAELPSDPIALPYVHYVFPGIAGNDMQVPDSDALDLPNDLEITVRMSCDNWAGPGQMIVAKNNANSDGWWLFKQTGLKRLSFRITGNPTNMTVDLPFTNGRVYWIKAQYTKSTGFVNFYWYFDQAKEPTTEWVKIGPTFTNWNTGQVPTTEPMFIGNSNFVNPLAGQIRELILRGGDSTTPPVFRLTENDAYGKPGTLAFNANTGQPVTVRQTGTNVIVRDATVYQALPIVDDIPTIANVPIICTNKLETSWSRDRVINELSLANVRGSAITIIDDASQKKFGPKTYQRLDFLNDNAHPEYLTTRASDIMTNNVDASIRVNAVSYNPAIQEPGWFFTLFVFLNDLVRVRYTHPTEGWGYSMVAHVQGMEHTIDTKNWRTRIALDDYEAFSYWIDAPANSGWDTGSWDDDIWDGAGNPNTPAFWNAKYNWSDPDSKWG